MHCSFLDDLPSPPPEKTGWPWTEQSPRLPGTMPDGSSWPCVSIVTPSYNQGQFIEETIRSVLLQGYPDLEYIIIDGGSSDDSVDIIRRYAPWLTAWVSEPDRGQAHAINKGFAECMGDLLGWINSDDCLLPEALFHLATAFRQFPKSILLGDTTIVDEIYGHEWLARQRNVTFESMVEPGRYNIFWQQPGVYFPRALYRLVGELDETLRYVFDLDWMAQALQIAPVHYLHLPIARFRLHRASKTVYEASKWASEKHIVVRRYWSKINGLDIDMAEAAFNVHLAEDYLRLHQWDRKKGLEHLKIATRHHHWHALMSPKFWLLCLKALMPVRLLKTLRALRSFSSKYF